MAVLPSRGAPCRGLPVPGLINLRTGALLRGSTAIGRPGRSSWFVVSVIVFFLLQCVLAENEAEWLHGPGNVTVCEGVEAHFLWNYSASFREVEEVFVSKLPSYVVLIKKRGHSDPISFMDRTSLLVNGHFKFRLQNVTKADAGIYNLEVLFGKTGVIHDKAYLRVIDDADCPDFQRYKHPIVYEVVPVDGYVYFSYNRTFMFSQPGNVTLGTIIPAADPQVTTQLSGANTKCSCTGKKQRNSLCECDFSVYSNDVHEIQIKMTFVAYEESMTRIALGITGNMAFGNTVQPTTTRSETGKDSRPNCDNKSLLAATVIVSLLLTLAVGLIIGRSIIACLRRGKELKQEKAGGGDVNDPKTGGVEQSDSLMTPERDTPSEV